MPTALNIADILSRGVMIKDFLNNDLWTVGPVFLRETKEDWHKEPQLNVSVLDSEKIIERAVFKVNIQSICFTEKLVMSTSF